MPRKSGGRGGVLRVIGGTTRGRRLHSVPGDTTRPVTDRVKEAVFNIIGNDIQGARLLDLFAGTGAIGIEALSRGAVFVHFNDMNRQPIQTIKANLQLTGFSSVSEISCADAFKLLEGQLKGVFDYIYIAPPQYMGLWKRALIAADSHPNWMSQDAWVIVQIHPNEYEPCMELQVLHEFDRRHYGSTMVVFYRRT